MTKSKKITKKPTPAALRAKAASLIRQHGVPSQVVVRDPTEASVRALVLSRIEKANPAGPKSWLSNRAGSGRDVAYRFVEGKTTTSADNLLEILAACGVVLVVDPKWDPERVPVIR